MLKKTLLSLAITASTAGLTACNISSIDNNDDVAKAPIQAGTDGYIASSASPVFSVARGNLPVHIDLLFADASATDGTASLADTAPPVTTAINDLAGFSATASIDLAFSAALDPKSVKAGSSVWLVELKSKEDNSLIDSLDLNTIVAAFPANPFADGADQLAPGTDYVAEYVEMDNGATPTIRIHPLKPLDPKTKYIVVLTDKLKDANGESASPSSEYDYLRGDLDLLDLALTPVRAAIKGWEQLAGGFLTVATAAAQTQENVILSYAFTTEANDDILLSMAAPENYIFGLFADTVGLEGAVGEDTVNAVVAGVAAALSLPLSATPTKEVLDAVDDGTATPAQKAAVAQWKAEVLPVRNTATYKTTLANSVAEKLVGEAGVTAIIAAVDEAVLGMGEVADTPAEISAVKASAIYASTLQGRAANGAGALLKGASHRPASRDFVAIPGVTIPHGPSGLDLPNPDAASMQGMLTLPQFMAKKSDDASSFWRSRDEDGISSVGAVIDGAFGNDPLSTPPKDDDGTGNVTYRFPFAQHVEDIKVPVLVTYPDANSGCSTPFKTIIFQHGITTDRTASLGFANSMAASCFATVAIDLPTHGLDASTTTADGVAERYAPFNAFNVAGYVLPPLVDGQPQTTPTPFAATIAGAGAMFDGLEERHENLALNATQEPVPMNFVAGSESGNSGDMFINLTNMQQTRDHLRQAVMDMLNLNASIAAMDIDGDGNGTNNDDPDLDASNVHFAGHSLGAITGLTFVAVNNAIANNPAIADKDLNPIKTAVLANPGGQLPKLLENSPSISKKILPGLTAAGLTQGMADLEKFFGVFQAPLDSVDPINFTDLLKSTDTPVLMFEMVGGGAVHAYDAANGSLPTVLINAGGYPADTVVPNNANPALNGVATAKSYLAGTDPLIKQLGLVEVAPTPTNQAGSMLVTKFDQGTHGTFSSADAPLVFKEMIEKTTTFMLGNGAGVQVVPAQP